MAFNTVKISDLVKEDKPGWYSYQGNLVQISNAGKITMVFLGGSDE